jgi:hypothetical protein
MADVVEGGCAQQFQHFISNSPWRHEPVVAQIAADADALLGGQDDSCLIIDESSFPKQGERSVGVARQWSGRLGKVDNCQVAGPLPARYARFAIANNECDSVKLESTRLSGKVVLLHSLRCRHVATAAVSASQAGASALWRGARHRVGYH